MVITFQKKTAGPRNRTWVSSATKKCTDHYTRPAFSELLKYIDIYTDIDNDKYITDKDSNQNQIGYYVVVVLFNIFKKM